MTEAFLDALPFREGDELATREDLHVGLAEVRAETAEVRAEMAEVRAEMADLRVDHAGLRVDLAGLRSEMHQLHSRTISVLLAGMGVMTALLAVLG